MDDSEIQLEDYKDKSIIQVANDNCYNRGLFMLISDEAPRILYQKSAKFEGSTEYNYFLTIPESEINEPVMGLPEPLIQDSVEESSYVMYPTQLVCYHKGVLDVVVDQKSIAEYSEIN